MPESELLFLAHGNDVGHLGHIAHHFEHFGLARPGKQILQGQIIVEMVFNNSLILVRNEDHILQSRGLRLLDNVLHNGLIVDGQHFLGNVFGGRQGPRSPPGDGDDHFLDFHALLLGYALPGMVSEWTGARR